MSSSVSAAAKSFGEVLARRAEELPDERIFTFLNHEDDTEETLTFSQLHQQAQDIAALLREKVPADSRALLLFPPGLDYLRALYGCLQAGIVGASAPPPQPKRLHRTLPRLTAIAADAEIGAVLTTESIAEVGKSLFKEGALAEVEWIATDTAPEGGEVVVASPDPAETAFLQYTSGSTRAPKGVMLSHENLVSNCELMTRAGKLRSDPMLCGAYWLPPYHDMGLVAGLLLPLHVPFKNCVLMSPLAVIKRPARWLEAVSRHRATFSGGPNFAYDLCVHRIDAETRERLDLSSWTVAFNGAEPIRAETLETFSEQFGPSGFDRKAFWAVYGLAESTLMTTGGEREREPTRLEVDTDELEAGFVRPATDASRSRTLVGCGTAFENSQAIEAIEVVDADTGRICENGEVGEIWLAGASVASGYWGNPDETARVFGASLPHDPDTPYLRTGDLGAFFDGELYVIGRIKELIILNGRNIHPHDIEDSAEAASELLRSHCSAAFELEVEGEIRIGIVLEVNPAEDIEYEEIMAAVKKRVAHDLDLPLYWIGLCSPGTVPKTTSGKIQRRLTKAMLEENDLELLAETPTSEPRPGTEPALR